MSNEKEYFAFISYKREDEKWAKWLQHKLEHYKLPSNLNGRTDLPKEIRPIFRDQSELAGGVLEDEINKALVNSKYLIVICSPRAAQSVWVGKEVQTFIDLGRTDKIIPFIIGGMAHAQNPEEECFPLALLNLPPDQELLGINIDEMGRDAAAVKVVAQMFGLKFDALWQRYERESRRRRIIIVVAAMLLALVSVSVAVWMSRLNKSIREKNIEIIKQKEEIEEQNKEIHGKNDRLLEDSIIMAAQLDSIMGRDVLIGLQKDSILLANQRIIQKNSQIKEQNKELKKQKLVQDIEISRNFLSKGNPEMAIASLLEVKDNTALLDSMQQVEYNNLLLIINDSIEASPVDLVSISGSQVKKSSFGLYDYDDYNLKTKAVSYSINDDGQGVLIIRRPAKAISDAYDTIIGFYRNFRIDGSQNYIAYYYEGDYDERYETDFYNKEIDTVYSRFKSGIRIVSLYKGAMEGFIACNADYDWSTYPLAVNYKGKKMVYREGVLVAQRDQVYWVDFDHNKRVCINDWNGTFSHTSSRYSIKSEFSPHDKYFFIYYELDNSVSIFSSSSEKLYTFRYRNVNEVYWNDSDDICISADGNLFVWRISDSFTAIYHTGLYVENVAITDGGLLAAVNSNGAVNIWNNQTKTNLLKGDVLIDDPDDLVFSRNGNTLWVSSMFSEIKCYDMRQKQLFYVKDRDSIPPRHWSCFLKITPDDRFCVAFSEYSPGYYYLIDVDSKRLLLKKPSNQTEGFSYLKKEDRVGFVTRDSLSNWMDRMDIYDIKSMELVNSVNATDAQYESIGIEILSKNRSEYSPSIENDELEVTCRTKSLDGKMIVEGYSDGTVKVKPVVVSSRFLNIMGCSK